MSGALQAVYQNLRSFGALDAQFNYVTMLLHGDGTNGAQNNTFLDSSTNNFTITRNGNTTQGSFSPYGSNWSVYTNALSTYFTSGTNAVFGFGTGDWTFEFFINSVSFTDNQFIVDFRPSGSPSSIFPWIYLTTTGVLNYGTDGAVKINSSASAVTGNTWTHVAVSKASGSTRMFVNGTQVGLTYTDSNDYGSSARFVSGTFGDAPGGGGGTGFVQGYLSNLRILKGTGLYTGSYTVPTSPLTAITNTSCLTFQSNRFIDNSSNSIAITPTGSPSVQRFNPFGASTAYDTSVIGGSMYLDGTTDFVKTPSDVNLSSTLLASNFTIECWIYLAAYPSSGAAIWTNSVTNADGFTSSYINANGTVGTGKVNVNEFNTTTTIKLNTWTHFAIVRNSGTLYVYFNGVQDATTGAASTYLNTTATKPMQIGSSNQSPPTAMQGYMSDFRVVASAVYTTGFTPNTAPLTAISGTNLLLSTINAGIFDNGMMNNLETVGNAQISTSVKKYGTGSIALDGAGDYLTVPSTPDLSFTGNFTVEAWLYLTTAPTGANAMYVCDFRNGSTSNFGFGVIASGGNTKPYMFVGSGPIETTCATSLSLNTWYHIAMVRSGSTVTYYLNGVSDGTMTTSFSQGATGVTVGARYTGTTEYVAGYIDDLRITKGYARYTTTFTPPTAALPDIGPT